MKSTCTHVPRKIRLTALLIPFFVFGSIAICSAQSEDASQHPKKKKPYTLRINKGTYWLGGGLGIKGSVAPLGQYIGTAANLEIKGGYHVIDKFSVGLTITGAMSISSKKEAGVYTRGISLLAGPLLQYMIPISGNFYLAPTAAVTYGPINIKSMTSGAGEPEQYVKVKGHAVCEIVGIGPFFEVIPGRASFGAHLLFSALQQTTNIYTNNGDKVPGTEIKDRKTGPGMIMEFKVHF
ncbi:hypothetical protein [Chitinophaga tropicalis]|uniref:Outer membrane protein beta-barrel domain-containing protein n=1 Tax=Chitinophaga tropicalis TaxID=2683588 RepID=A0A7K1U0N8_9BACT|nr:hypothetical protein [Chitinophaga tropicalis]MVT07934.1 hypothetical protein [Chitinophaga tropicalis]